MATDHSTETVPQWKHQEVDELVDLIESYDSVGVVDVTGIPSRQLQQMRSDLRYTAELRMSRNTLLQRALESVDEGLEELTEFIGGQVGLIGTDENPFGLYRQLEASKTSAPISAGDVAPNDIVISAGDTGIDPGPFVGELQEVGANARIQEGSIQVLEDSTVLSAGEEVSRTLEGVLGELGIEPKEVGLDLRAVYSDGVLFEPEDLVIDVAAYRDEIARASSRARNLAVNAAYPTHRTVPALLGTASGEAKSLAIHAAIEDPAVMPSLVERADNQMRALAARVDDESALPESLRDVAPTHGEESDQDRTDEQETDSEPEATDTDDEDDDAEDDSDGDGAEGLGEMFG